MRGDVIEQPRNIYAALADTMKEASGELADIARLGTLITDVAYCEPVQQVQREVFGVVRLATTIVFVSALLKPEKTRNRSAARLGPAGERWLDIMRRRARPRMASRRFLHPQTAPAGRRDVAIDHLARIRGDEEIAAVTLLAVFRIRLIFDGSLRQLRLRFTASQREERRGASGGQENGAAADSGIAAKLTHESLVDRLNCHWGRRASAGTQATQFRMISNWPAVNRRPWQIDASRASSCRLFQAGCGAIVSDGARR